MRETNLEASHQRVDLLIRGGTIITMDPAGLELEGDVAVSDGRVVAVGPALNAAADRVVDATDAAVLPGLVNAHTHECMERGWFEDLPFMRWLNEFALPKDRAYEPRHMRASAWLNQLEMIRGGTTTFIDIFRYPTEAAAVAVETGLRGIFSPQIIDEPEGVGESLDDAEAFIEEWKDRVPDRIKTWFGPHSLYSCTETTYRRIREEADRLGVGIHTHLAESRDEVEIVAERTGGLTPVEYLDRLVGLSPGLVAAHCIQVTNRDIQLLASRNAAVAHCPTSNMKLANGAAPILRLLGAGVTVGLGTDSIMTNNNLDMFEEMRQAAILQKLVTGDATALSCRDVLRMATVGSARALGLDSEIGTIEVGKRADLILVDLDSPQLWPVFTKGGGNVVEQIVYAASAANVRTTIVDGRVLMDDRRVSTVNVDEVRDLVDREARHLMEKAGVHRAFQREGAQ